MLAEKRAQLHALGRMLLEMTKQLVTNREASIVGVGIVMTLAIYLLMFSLGISATPWSMGAFVVVDLVGIVLVSVVVFDLLDRLEAKQELAELFSHSDRDSLHILWNLYLDGPSFYVFQDPRKFPESFPEEWHRLRTFLRSYPYGALASQALFQRSPVGRHRYFCQVLRMSGHLRERASD
jgi:hypothetical protein